MAVGEGRYWSLPRIAPSTQTAGNGTVYWEPIQQTKITNRQKTKETRQNDKTTVCE